MSDDFILSELAGELVGAGKQKQPVDIRQAVISAVNVDGTYDIKVGGSTKVIPSVFSIRTEDLAVNDDVWVLVKGNMLLVIGSTKVTPAPPAPFTGAQASYAVPSDRVTVTNSWQFWGGSVDIITIPDPGEAVTVIAHLTGFVENDVATASRYLTGVRVSIHNGSVWSDGLEKQHRVKNDSYREANVSASHFWSGTPSNDILVRAQFINYTAAAGDVVWKNGFLTATVLPI